MQLVGVTFCPNKSMADKTLCDGSNYGRLFVVVEVLCQDVVDDSRVGSANDVTSLIKKDEAQMSVASPHQGAEERAARTPRAAL